MNYLYIGMLVAFFYFAEQTTKRRRGLHGMGGVTPPCPPATQDLGLNTANRQRAIDEPWIRYGPLNLADEGYWDMVAARWKTSRAVAKQSRCSNCVAFDISPRMSACMPGSVQKQGRLGYCHMHHFKCHSSRTCLTWAAGGPITTDVVSYSWDQRRIT